MHSAMEISDFLLPDIATWCRIHGSGHQPLAHSALNAFPDNNNRN